MAALLPVLALMSASGAAGQLPAPTLVTRSFTNPLRITMPEGGLVHNCPDPTVIRGRQAGDNAWYMFCTAGPLNDQDKLASGEYKQHLIPILKSVDLVEWTYVGDAFTERPGWAKPDTEIRAPEVVYFSNQYYLYYTISDERMPESDNAVSAIGVATSQSPMGPWTHAARPVVEPHEAPCCADSRRWVFDPEVIVDESGNKYIYYGSYFGGISVRKLSEDGLSSDVYSQVEVTISHRYEAANVIKRGEYYYLLGSGTECCKGPLTGYSVFAGRSKEPWGPSWTRRACASPTTAWGARP